MDLESVELGYRAYVEPAAAADPAFTPPVGRTFNFYTSGETGKLKWPMMTFEMEDGRQIHPGTPVSQGTLKIWIETQAESGETEATHSARCIALENILAGPAPTNDSPGGTGAVAAVISAGGLVRIFGYAVLGFEREVKDRCWITGYALSVGYGPPPTP